MKLKHLLLQLSLLLVLFACSKEEDEDFHKPEISTSEVSEITNTRATCGGNLTSNGHLQITAEGLVWNTSANVSLEENTGKTAEENKTGKYVSTLTDLRKNTTYYVRAYATNDLGTTYGEEREFTTANGIDMVFVQEGTFQLGSSEGDPDELPIHSVSLSSFEIGKYEIMQAQWTAVMGTNPSHFKGDSLPVEQVSWNEIEIFIEKLNEQTGLTYRLPTEAEWEFASMGGNSSHSYIYSGSNSLDEVAWYANNSDNRTHKVGSKQANELGIYDMTGNVWEWCFDIPKQIPKELHLDLIALIMVEAGTTAKIVVLLLIAATTIQVVATTIWAFDLPEVYSGSLYKQKNIHRELSLTKNT